MRKRRFILQKYISASETSRGEWHTVGKVRGYFLDLCGRAALYTKKDKISRQILLYPNGNSMAAFRYDLDNKYNEVYSELGAKLRKLEEGAKEEAIKEEAEPSYVIEEVEEDDGKREAIRRYNDCLGAMSWLQRASGSYPGLYQCRRCRWYFTRVSGRQPMASCPKCRGKSIKKR